MGESVLAKWRNLAPQLLSVLRIVCAFMFLQVGAMKLFGWPMAMPGGGTVPLLSQMGVGGVLEVVGGGLLLVGLFTRPVAFLLSGEMAVAYFQFHQPNGTWPLVNQGQPAALFCFIWFNSIGRRRRSMEPRCAPEKIAGRPCRFKGIPFDE